MNWHFLSRIAHNSADSGDCLEWRGYMKCVEYKDGINVNAIFVLMLSTHRCVNGKLTSKVKLFAIRKQDYWMKVRASKRYMSQCAVKLFYSQYFSPFTFFVLSGWRNARFVSSWFVLAQNKPLPYKLLAVSDTVCNWFTKWRNICICNVWNGYVLNNYDMLKIIKTQDKARRSKIRQDKTRRNPNKKFSSGIEKYCRSLHGIQLVVGMNAFLWQIWFHNVRILCGIYMEAEIK